MPDEELCACGHDHGCRCGPDKSLEPDYEDGFCCECDINDRPDHGFHDKTMPID